MDLHGERAAHALGPADFLSLESMRPRFKRLNEIGLLTVLRYVIHYEEGKFDFRDWSMFCEANAKHALSKLQDELPDFVPNGMWDRAGMCMNGLRKRPSREQGIEFAIGLWSENKQVHFLLHGPGTEPTIPDDHPVHAQVHDLEYDLLLGLYQPVITELLKRISVPDDQPLLQWLRFLRQQKRGYRQLLDLIR